MAPPRRCATWFTLPNSRNVVVLAIAVSASGTATTAAPEMNEKVVSGGSSLTYSVANEPTWTQVSAATGSLPGTLNSGSVGTDTNVVVSVSNGAQTAALPASNLAVSPPALSLAPVPPPATFGTWINVTPAGVNLTDVLDCGNYGTQSVQVDPANPSNLYAQFNCQGIWKSTDYGQTWTGPINTGANGATAGDGAGGIAVVNGTAGGPATIYLSNIRGGTHPATGFWVSTDGGRDWTNYHISPLASDRQDVYAPVVDPYNPQHLLMCGHEQNYILQSFNGGKTWTNVPLNRGMLENGGTGFIWFVNTGNASTTANTWLWLAQGTGGTIGTWRTSNSGTTWTQVDTNEHPHGAFQSYQSGTSGTMYMAGIYSVEGWGVLMSENYGQTWTHIGATQAEGLVTGTPNNLYAMSFRTGLKVDAPALFEYAPAPGTGTWSQGSVPAGLYQGAAQIAVTNDRAHIILVGAMWGAGIWRYIEAASMPTAPKIRE
jgi:hypothetical protein